MKKMNLISVEPGHISSPKITEANGKMDPEFNDFYCKSAL